MKKMMPSFRRYSEPCLTAVEDEVDCHRIPPLHDVVASNNDNNETFDKGSIECESSLVERGLDNEEIDDDWLMKFTKLNEFSSERVPPYDGTNFDGSTCTEIPFLFGDDLDFKEKTMRTFRRGMKKIWKRGSATITEADPTNKVVYLGNYLTGWAKGEGCVEKPLHTIWKNYSTSTKPDVQMKLTVTQSGLKAVTKDHGLTEYWSHRITYCSAPANLPRVFCWVYRHEGRKLKQELRCHAVLCSKESVAKRMASTLRLRLTQALSEFKRDKILKQNARLSLVNSVYENPSLPRRKILLSIGSQNYRPPLERSKSAPKLMAIEESLEEEDSSPKSRKKTRKRGEVGCGESDGDTDNEGDEDGEEGDRKGESESESENEGTTECDALDEKLEFKITNLNFVKKLCSSIENLVESTSNYGKKLLSERRSSKDSQLSFKKVEDSILKKGKSCEEEEGGNGKKPKVQKNVKFEGEERDLKVPKTNAPSKKESEEASTGKSRSEVLVEVKDVESDEGSNSLQSNSSWSSDASSLVTVSSDKSNDVKADDPEDKGYLKDAQMYRLHTYLSSCKDVYLDEGKVVLHPTGEIDIGGTGHGDDAFPMTRIDREETDSFSEEDDGGQQEEDVVSDESGYVELADHIVKRLSLDRKEKDVPYHQIIKSGMLRPRRFESSCLQV